MCAEKWDKTNAFVVCQQLGFAVKGIIVIMNTVHSHVQIFVSH